MPAPQNPWRNRTRRLLYFFGASTTIYLALSYAFDRMREARLRALKERKERDLLKQHFTSLISTISFTLYALLPTLQPQLAAEYPVELISQALQGLSITSSASESIDPTPDTSMVLQAPTADIEVPSMAEPNDPSGHVEPASPASAASASSAASAPSPSSPGPSMGVEQSWSSEFKTESVAESEQPSLVGDSLLHEGEDDALSSTLSQSISLPPTDISSSSPSPPSTESPLRASPPQPSRPTMAGPSPYAGKSKKELWRDLKIHTLTRTLTTAYIIPLLYLLTSSQLSTLARQRYLHDVDDNLQASKQEEAASRAAVSSTPKKRGLFGYFSTDAMGLADFVDNHTPSYLNPARYLPTAVSQYLPFGGAVPEVDYEADSLALAARKEEIEADRAEDERVYLTYSWWILHEGWRGVAKRVEDAVEEVFGGMALKRELQVGDWQALVREVRARVETQPSVNGTVLYSFLPQMLPTYPLPPLTTSDANPLPTMPPVHRPHLASLLEQTTIHLKSADATYLIEKGVTAMTRKMIEGLKEDLYTGSEIGLMLGEPAADQEISRRLVDCLPAIDRWGKGVWDAIPDTGIENLTAIPEFEAFAALVFGDWAPR